MPIAGRAPTLTDGLPGAAGVDPRVVPGRVGGPDPALRDYQERWHFSPVTTTVVFAVYALAVLASLLTFGKLSDHVGRRPVLAVAIAVQMLALVVFIFANGVPALLVARLVQGLAAGAATGAVGAAMLDIDRARGTLANSIAPGIGTGSGALLSALLIQFLPAPTRLVYVVLLVILLIQAVGVALMPETVTPMAGARRSLRPDITLPRPYASRSWSSSRCCSRSGHWPASSARSARRSSAALMNTSIVVGGLVLFVFAVFGSVAVLLQRNTAARTVILTGIVALILGMIVTLVSVMAQLRRRSSSSASRSGASASAAASRAASRRSCRWSRRTNAPGVLSVLYVVCYVGFGLPTVIAGFLVVYAGGLPRTADEYSVAVILLALVALSRGTQGHQDGAGLMPGRGTPALEHVGRNRSQRLHDQEAGAGDEPERLSPGNDERRVRRRASRAST